MGRSSRKDPAWYKNSLRAQFKYLCNTYIVALYGVNRAEMCHLENSIIETNLVMAVHPHQETDTIGRWNLLIHKENLSKTFKAIQTTSLLFPLIQQCVQSGNLKEELEMARQFLTATLPMATSLTRH